MLFQRSIDIVSYLDSAFILGPTKKKRIYIGVGWGCPFSSVQSNDRLHVEPGRSRRRAQDGIRVSISIRHRNAVIFFKLTGIFAGTDAGREPRAGRTS